MEFHPHLILTFLLVVAVISHASHPSEDYWKSTLPNTPIPKAVQDLLQPDGSSTDAGKASTVAEYGTVYGNRKKAVKSSLSAHKASSVSRYDTVYGKSQSSGRSSIKADKASPVAGYETVYGNHRKIGGNSMKVSLIAGYDSVYGNSRSRGGSSFDSHKASPVAGYDSVYGNSRRSGGSSFDSHEASPVAGYDTVYGKPQNSGGSFINTDKAGLVSQYETVYGNPQNSRGSFINGDKTSPVDHDKTVYENPKNAVRNPINSRKHVQVAGYDTVYGNPQNSGSSFNADKASLVDKYDIVYGPPQNSKGSSISGGKTSSVGNYKSIYGNPKNAVERSLTDSKASPVAGYDTVYGKPQKMGRSSINSRKISPVAGYDSVYGNPKNSGGSSETNMEQQHQDGDSAANIFLEKDLHPGTKVKVRFTKTTIAAHFLPRRVAESIPFSSTKLPEILDRFSVKENSEEATSMKKTIQDCEAPAIEGEDKFCATSLESLIDFSTSKLGKNIRVLSNVVEVEIQEYEFGEGVKMVADKSVVCHQLNYPYSVAYCHTLHMTNIYRVPLMGADGSRIEAVAVCHKDTSTWDPNALAFQALKVKPGTLAICHFLPNGHMVWVPN